MCVLPLAAAAQQSPKPETTGFVVCYVNEGYRLERSHKAGDGLAYHTSGTLILADSDPSLDRPYIAVKLDTSYESDTTKMVTRGDTGNNKRFFEMLVPRPYFDAVRQLVSTSQSFTVQYETIRNELPSNVYISAAAGAPERKCP
jgi:hypothetical protein